MKYGRKIKNVLESAQFQTRLSYSSRWSWFVIGTTPTVSAFFMNKKWFSAWRIYERWMKHEQTPKTPKPVWMNLGKESRETHVDSLVLGCPESATHEFAVLDWLLIGAPVGLCMETLAFVQEPAEVAMTDVCLPSPFADTPNTFGETVHGFSMKGSCVICDSHQTVPVFFVHRFVLLRVHGPIRKRSQTTNMIG